VAISWIMGWQKFLRQTWKNTGVGRHANSAGNSRSSTNLAPCEFVKPVARILLKSANLPITSVRRNWVWANLTSTPTRSRKDGWPKGNIALLFCQRDSRLLFAQDIKDRRLRLVYRATRYAYMNHIFARLLTPAKHFLLPKPPSRQVCKAFLHIWVWSVTGALSKAWGLTPSILFKTSMKPFSPT
jgi:hypothetical protein